MSIRVYQQPAEGGIPKGSERSQWWVMRPSEGSNGNAWFPAFGLIANTSVAPNFATGSAGTYGVAADAAAGMYRFLQGVTNVSPVFATLSPPGLMWNPSAMNQLQLFANPAAEVLIFRELIQHVITGGPLPANHEAAHGFSLVGNLLTGFPLLTTGAWRGIAIIERTADVVLAVKNANPATVFPLPGVSLSAARILVEHRLYASTGTRIGRYELWLNQRLVQVVNGDHPSFPQSILTTTGWRFMPFALNNPGTAITVSQRAWWGEIIVGPNSEGTF